MTAAKKTKQKKNLISPQQAAAAVTQEHIHLLTPTIIYWHNDSVRMVTTVRS